MKLAFTVADATDSLMAGGEVERRTAILEILEEQIQGMVRNYFLHRNDVSCFLTLSISIVEP